MIISCRILLNVSRAIIPMRHSFYHRRRCAEARNRWLLTRATRNQVECRRRTIGRA